MSANLDKLLTPEQLAEARAHDDIPRRADRRAPPDASSIAALIRLLPTLDTEGCSVIVAALSGRAQHLGSDPLLIGDDVALEALDTCAIAFLDIREVTSDELEQWAREDRKNTLRQEARGN